VDISKSGSRFAHHGHLESAAAPIFKQLAEEHNLAGLEREQFAARVAHYLGELNALHPFREGNGRTQREFIGQLAQANGYAIAWETIRQAPMLDAAIASFHGDASKLAQLLVDNLTVEKQRSAEELADDLAAKALTVDESQQHGQELDDEQDLDLDNGHKHGW
jgi:cell filamentation protein